MRAAQAAFPPLCAQQGSLNYLQTMSGQLRAETRSMLALNVKDWQEATSGLLDVLRGEIEKWLPGRKMAPLTRWPTLEDELAARAERELRHYVSDKTKEEIILEWEIENATTPLIPFPSGTSTDELFGYDSSDSDDDPLAVF